MKNKNKISKKNKFFENVTTLSEADSFNIEYWQAQSPQIRFSAVWKTIDEFYKMRGINGYKYRLQRSVQHIKQIQS